MDRDKRDWDRAAALAPVTAFPQSLSSEGGCSLESHYSLSATQHTICTKPGSSSQTTKATARKSMALKGMKLMPDTEQTGSGYLTTGWNQKNTTQNKKCISTCTEMVKINSLLAIGDEEEKMNQRPFLVFTGGKIWTRGGGFLARIKLLKISKQGSMDTAILRLKR